uniref:Uncharacterized protein n=1 Tax=Anguilla anguilla TaxID=7936 RepID=A0A0E9U6Z2_ANGAN
MNIPPLLIEPVPHILKLHLLNAISVVQKQPGSHSLLNTVNVRQN